MLHHGHGSVTSRDCVYSRFSLCRAAAFHFLRGIHRRQIMAEFQRDTDGDARDIHKSLKAQI